MSEYLNKIVYLSQDQYNTLMNSTNNPKTITVNGITHTYDASSLYITNNKGDADTVNGHTVNIDVPYNALFTDHYHTSGTWDDITYTATSVNGANPLTFTLPTDNRYYKLDGSNTGTALKISTQTSAYTNQIQFMNSTTKKGSIGCDNNGITGIYAASKITLRAALDGDTTTGLEVTTAAVYPSTAITLGTTSNKWSAVYATTFNGSRTSLTHATDASDGLRIKYSTTIDFFIGVGTSNANHGLYDYEASGGAKWILSAGSDNVWTFVGNVTGNVSGSSGSCTGNATTATSSKVLANQNGTYGTATTTSNRVTDTNIAHVNNGGVTHFKVGAATNGPANGGNILHFYWDTSDAWDAQLHIPNNSANSMSWRASSAIGIWDSWRTLLDANNYTTYAVAKTAGVTAVTWDATNKKLTRTINDTDADVMTAAQMSTALGLGTIAFKAATDYLPVKYSNLDYTSTTTTMGIYPINKQTHPVTGKTEYGGAIQFGGISTSNNHYAAQLLVSSENGGTSPVHAYIRRMTSTPGWSNWTALLDSNNYTDYTVTKTGTGASGSWGISITGSSASCTGNAATAAAIQTAGTTAQFYRGDNSWSNIIKQTANAALDITNLKIGTSRKDLNFDIAKGSGTGINDGYAGGITWGTGDEAYAGIYYQASSSYGSRLIFGTTASYANGAYARMIIQNNGNVGIGTLSPDTLLTINGNAKATKFIGALEGNADTASKISAKLEATTKTYLLGTSTAITATAADVEVIGDTGVYLTATAGQFNATTYLVNEKVRMEYNSTDQSLDFIFI